MKEVGPIDEKHTESAITGAGSGLNTLSITDGGKHLLSSKDDNANLKYVKDGTLPEFGVSENDKLAQVTNTKSQEKQKDHHKYYPDILPNIDLDEIRDYKKSGDKTPFKYRSFQSNKRDSSPLLTEEDRRNSIMYKMEKGLADPKKLFKNPEELMNTGAKDGRDGKKDQPERDAEAAPPYKYERLEVDEAGKTSVTVQPGDNLWNITKGALKHNQEEGYTPSNRDIANALEKVKQANPDISNPDLIRPGDKITIPPDILKADDPPQETPEEVPEEVPEETPEIPEETPEAEGPRIEVENHGASEEFAGKMQEVVDSLSPGVRRLLEANGTKIKVGDRVSSVYPELAGVRPRGWPPGTTWDNNDGLYQPRDKTAVVTEHRLNSSGEVEDNTRAEGGMKHEIGHAVDHALGNFSQSEEFRQAYEQDTAGMTDAEKTEFSYLLQAGNAGKSEAFGEVFGALNGASANPWQTERILQKFPNVANLVRRKLDAL